MIKFCILLEFKIIKTNISNVTISSNLIPCQKPGIEIKFTLGITRRNGINIIEKEDDLFTEFKLFCI